MAKKRTPQELARIKARKEFVQSNPELDPAEARKRFFVQTRVQELEKSGVEVTKERRAALRQKFATGGVQRQGFYTPQDVAKYTTGGSTTTGSSTTNNSTVNPPKDSSIKRPEIRTNNVLGSRKTTSTPPPTPIVRASVETPKGYQGKSPAAGTLKYSKASYQSTKNLQKNAQTYEQIVAGLTKKGMSFEKAQETAKLLPGVYERTDKAYFEKSGAGKAISNIKDELYAASGMATFRQGQEERKTNEAKGIFYETLGVGIMALNAITLLRGAKGKVAEYNAKKFGVPQLGPGKTARFESKSTAALENKATVEAAKGSKGPFLAEPVKVPFKVKAAQDRARLQAQMELEARTLGTKVTGPKASQTAKPAPTEATVVKPKGNKGKGGKGKVKDTTTTKAQPDPKLEAKNTQVVKDIKTEVAKKTSTGSTGQALIPKSLAEVKAVTPKSTSGTPSRVPLKNKFKSQQEFNAYWGGAGRGAFNLAPTEFKTNFIKLNQKYIDAFRAESSRKALQAKILETQRVAEVKARNAEVLKAQGLEPKKIVPKSEQPLRQPVKRKTKKK
jgi:hypothetical protein